MTHYWKNQGFVTASSYRTHEINNRQVCLKCYIPIWEDCYVLTSAGIIRNERKKGDTPTKTAVKRRYLTHSHAALRFQDLPLEVRVNFCKLRSEWWGSTEVAPRWRAPPTDSPPARPAQKAATPVPAPGSPPAAPILSTGCGTVALLPSLSFTPFTIRSLMSVNVDIKPGQIVASGRRQNCCTYCLLCLQINHCNRLETCLVITNLLMGLFDKAPWPWAPPWRTRSDAHRSEHGLVFTSA